MNDTKSSNSSHTLDNLAPEYQVTVRILELLDKTDYKIVQENGQRRLTAPEITGQERVKGAEIFIGRLPRDCYEDELMPVLEKVDRLMELRLMLDFSGSTRGYAFASFKDSKTARRACEMLNEYEIRPGHKIGVVKSIDNCRLFFGGVPKDKTKMEFHEELSRMLDGIVDIHVYPNAQDRRLNRGFIFVEFKDHRSAAMARRRLIPGKVLLWNQEIAVDWADPEPGDPIDDEVMETVTALFLRNLCLETTQQQIKEILQKTTKIPIIKLKKINHFAFVHYETRESAEQVLKMLTKPDGVADNHGWEVRWAKPVATFKSSERQKCIIEACNKSNQTDTKFIQKDFITKYKNHPPSISSLPINMPVSKILDDFVINNFKGICVFEILPLYEPNGYVCKIIILKDGCIFFEYYGNIMPTKTEAVEVSANIVYNHMIRHINTYITPSYLPATCNTNVMKSPLYFPHFNASF